ncbi:MAG: hypothetical protein CM1200mP23_2870 [Nitrososphaerota archaeon]|nr:MAG: hypothetical protein CM1200mP23_2870 [Nitrososphaerota archaeon]
MIFLAFVIEIAYKLYSKNKIPFIKKGQIPFIQKKNRFLGKIAKQYKQLEKYSIIKMKEIEVPKNLSPIHA